MITIVLVHGMFHGPWCWDRLVPLLRGGDVVVATPDLSRNPMDPGPAQQAVDAAAERGPVIVCGHSFGGYAATALTPEKITRMVLLAAYVLDDWEWFPTLPTTSHFFEMVATDAAGVMTPKPERATELFYGDCTTADAEWAIAKLCSSSAEGMKFVMSWRLRFPRARPERPAWREVPTTYVQCELDNVFTQEYMTAARAHVGTGLSMPTSHSPMLSRPDLVANLLNSVVAEVSADRSRP
jgi:pimeloyl-ACP methyl ester carboxylesterase